MHIMNFIVRHEFVRFLFLYRFLLISCVLLIEKCSKERKSKNKEKMKGEAEEERRGETATEDRGRPQGNAGDQ